MAVLDGFAAAKQKSIASKLQDGKEQAADSKQSSVPSAEKAQDAR